MKESESKAWEPTRRKERKTEERRGTRIAWHFVSVSVRRQEQEKEDGKERVKGKGACPGIVCWSREGRHSLQGKAWTGAESAVWVFALWIQSHDSLLCPACLAGPGSSPQLPTHCSIYPQMPSFTPASPPPRLCLLSIHYTTSPLERWMI